MEFLLLSPGAIDHLPFENKTAFLKKLKHDDSGPLIGPIILNS